LIGIQFNSNLIEKKQNKNWWKRQIGKYVHEYNVGKKLLEYTYLKKA
jgi:hypothetical protein